MALDIRNDHSKGSINLLTVDQVVLFNNIVQLADKFFEIEHPESEKYNISENCRDVPIYLIPYKTYIAKMQKLCKSPFAKKMRKKYKKELAELENLPQEERYKREQILRKKYGPWICPVKTPKCTGCTKVWETPLGYFVPEERAIYICYDRIVETYPKDQVDAITAKVILHELGHALMYNPDHLHYETLFEHWAEESLANKIALKYLAVASYLLRMPDLFIIAKNMVTHQPYEYALGLYLFDHNASDWHTLREGKTHINDTRGDQWVEAVCESPILFDKIQHLFFRTFEQIVTSSSASGFETWLRYTAISSKGGPLSKDTVPKYLSFIESTYIGSVCKDIMGWPYNTLADCKSSREISYLVDELVNERIFNLATYGNATSATNRYIEYLQSLGL